MNENLRFPQGTNFPVILLIIYKTHLLFELEKAVSCSLKNILFYVPLKTKIIRDSFFWLSSASLLSLSVPPSDLSDREVYTNIFNFRLISDEAGLITEY